MTRFVSLFTGKPYDGKVPTEVVLPESEKVGDQIATREVTYRKGDPAWPQALQRWMFLQAYVPEEDMG